MRELHHLACDACKVDLFGTVPALDLPAEFTERYGFARIPDVQLDAAAEVLTGVLAAQPK